MPTVGAGSRDLAPAAGAGRSSARRSAILVVGAMRWSWGLLELSGLFVALAIAAGLAGGLGANGTAERFLEGAAAIVPGAPRRRPGARRARDLRRRAGHRHHPPRAGRDGAGAAVGGDPRRHLRRPGRAQLRRARRAAARRRCRSRSWCRSATSSASPGRPASSPTSSATASRTSSPRRRATSWPALALIGVPWTRWARFIWPLQLAWLVAGLVLLLIAHAIGWS